MSIAATARKGNKSWQILKMRKLLEQEQVKSLLKDLESSYEVINTFWMKNKESYQTSGTELALTISNVANLMTKLMIALREGILPNRISITSTQKVVNYMCQIGYGRQPGYEYSNYMNAMGHITSILHNHLHPNLSNPPT
jgi:hypothetical protein